MKKYLKGIISLIVLLIIIVALSIITIYQYHESKKEPDLGEFGPVTFEFMGDSNHYNFSTGKVFFYSGEDGYHIDKKILISDFEQTNMIEGITKEKLTISFAGNVWKKTTRKIGLNNLYEPIKEYKYFEENKLNYNKNKKNETTAFDLATKDTFKKIMHIEIEYCTALEGCETEVFQLSFKE